MKSQVERILILAKTYPSPSAAYVETSCVAGINEHGAMRRLYPVPFRLIEQARQFKKWQWITARVEKAAKDHRVESHRVFVDTIVCGAAIESKKEWTLRWPWIDKIPVSPSFEDIEGRRVVQGSTLVLLRPKRILGLLIEKARNTSWTDEEREKLLREQMQGNLFSEKEAKAQVGELRKIPYDFYYSYLCETPEGEKSSRHKIVDWELGALYWNCLKDHGSGWEAPLRQKLEVQLVGKDLMFLMGNLHRFQDQWLIVSLIYPPRRRPPEVEQRSLL